MASQNQKVAIVTGVSSGIGRASATSLAAAGFRVFGTIRRATNSVIIDGVELIHVDVTTFANIPEGDGYNDRTVPWTSQLDRDRFGLGRRALALHRQAARRPAAPPVGYPLRTRPVNS